MMRSKGLFRAILVLGLCLMVVSMAYAKPPDLGPPVSVSIKYGYAMFRDDVNDVIQSDDGRQYIDCNIRKAGGEDRVELGILNDGTLDWAIFYPGRMYYHYPRFAPSTRRASFHNFALTSLGEPVTPGHEAVNDILLKYRDENGDYQDRNINDGSLHVPIVTNGQKSSEYRYHPYDDLIQFIIEPDTDNPGNDPRAVTSPKVDEFYPDDVNLVYWDASGREPAPYIIYHIVFEGDGGDPGFEGFTATPVDFDRKGKPITWVIAPDPALQMKLCVASPDWGEGGECVTLATYEDGLPFEFAVSLVPLTEYPGESAAPARHRSISTTWSDIKER